MCIKGQGKYALGKIRVQKGEKGLSVGSLGTVFFTDLSIL